MPDPDPTTPPPPRAQVTTVGGGYLHSPRRAPGESVAGSATPSELSQRSRPGGSTVLSSLTRNDERQTYSSDELAIVLSHYDLGAIEAIQEFPRGSRKSPKVVVRSDRGLYLLKRRAAGRNDPFKVAFCHALQLHLAQRQFPLPHLIGTRSDNNSMLQWKGAIYELFEYIKGGGYDNSLTATLDAGRVLGSFHQLLNDYQPEYEPPEGSYHAARSVAASLKALPETLNRLWPDSEQIPHLVQFLDQSYNDAARTVNNLGLPNWPTHIVHCDWHPGNMLFRGSRVVAVIDYDAARIQQRVIDVANGTLQFSILGGGDDPTQWPDYIDESRFKRFIRGYDAVPNQVLSRAELRTIPPLMIEALIAESVIPIAATGNFARMDGLRFLAMVERKVRWLQTHTDHLIATVDE